MAKMSDEPTKHFTVTSSEAVNTKKLANLTANTKNYGQITLNTKPHSDPPLFSQEINDFLLLLGVTKT